METFKYCQVALKAPLLRPLTYQCTESLKIGAKVKVSLGSKTVSGVVLETTAKPKDNIDASKIKSVLEILKDPPLSLPRLEWLQWMSRYYHYPIGLVMDKSFPPLKEKSLKNTNKEKEDQSLSVHKSSLLSSTDEKKTLSLNEEQRKTIQILSQAKGFKVHLLHGVTGSGKTEIYKALIKQNLKKGKQSLLLLPEIFLISQIFQRFLETFPKQAATIHSQLSQREKSNIWWNLLREKEKILIGTRSALFCPLPSLNLILVDEEHTASFKQEEKFQYHARDSAIMLAKTLDIPIVLGSATPSLTSWHLAQKGIYSYCKMKQRALKQPLPKIQVVDLKEKPKLTDTFWLSDELYLKIKETLGKKKQVALFLNRRGEAGMVLCPQCGYVNHCPNCDIALTLHASSFLLCHYCDYMEKKIFRCPKCSHSQWLEKGLGTARVEQVIQTLFPKAKILRADRDAIESQDEMLNFIRAVEKEEAQILIGTQMLSKGLDFPSLHLVGLLMADRGFHFPDFRASEQSFQMISQMAGRAGRKTPGEVLLQTYNPNHSSLIFAKNHDYEGFAKEELKHRKTLFYPPFSRLCLFQIDSLKEVAGRDFAKKTAQTARHLAKPQMRVLGPSPAPLYKIKNRYRFQILVKAPSHAILQAFLDLFLDKLKAPSFIRLKTDRDPVSMM